MVDISAFFAADIPKLLHAGRWCALLPSGLSGLLGGVVVLLYYLGTGAVVGLVGMAFFVTWGVLTQRHAHRLEEGVVERRDVRLQGLKRVIEAAQVERCPRTHCT
jgi:hypothetical protein